MISHSGIIQLMARRVEKPISWLPVDSRLVGQFLSFGRVRGAARIFLMVEMVLSISIVVGSLILTAMHFIR